MAKDVLIAFAPGSVTGQRSGDSKANFLFSQFITARPTSPRHVWPTSLCAIPKGHA